MSRTTTTPDPATDPAWADAVNRLAAETMARCDELARCTEEPGRITRRCFTEAMRAAHDQLGAWCADGGLSAGIDPAGNWIGRRPSASGASAPALLIGSHLDSVPDAGRYDGVLGVLVGLAAAELLGDRALPFELHVIGFTDEEGVRFRQPYFGSRAITGTFDHDWFDLRDNDEITLRDAMVSLDVSPDQIGDAAYQRDHLLGYVEVHLEQGPVLQTLGHPVGIVEGISGQSRLTVRFDGEAAHAGTMPMDQRHDAAVAAARWTVAVRDHARSIEGMRATVGRFNAEPGVRNVVPGSAVLSLDLRHLDNDTRTTAVAELLDAAERIGDEEGVRFSVERHEDDASAPMDSALTDHLAAAVEDAGHTPYRLVSGAGHDASVLSVFTPSALMFVRDPAGISHHPDESVNEPDVATTIDVLARLILRLTDQHGKASA